MVTFSVAYYKLVIKWKRKNRSYEGELVPLEEIGFDKNKQEMTTPIRFVIV